MTLAARGGTAVENPGKAPASNDEGVRSAVRQIKNGRLNGADVQVRYDRSFDTLYVRFRSSASRPSVSYFVPTIPEILLRLDMQTGELTGIEFTHLRTVLAKQDPLYAHMYHEVVRRRIRHFLRRHATPKRTLVREAADGILQHCPAA